MTIPELILSDSETVSQTFLLRLDAMRKELRGDLRQIQNAGINGLARKPNSELNQAQRTKRMLALVTRLMFEYNEDMTK